ncbi:hypothetical protein F3J24_09575 [Comamonas sp. Tr-654]|uniref:hypothetical protein n=1 Tax=Comamonas sp. Tr-654 TaxID=2608341 RepID=UPI00142353BA|nr:hypothetical protein [Comamonas sp. Tr-654]NIF83745.1 hypothetical protein [Comamonas sp. Tr-654]
MRRFESFFPCQDIKAPVVHAAGAFSLPSMLYLAGRAYFSHWAVLRHEARGDLSLGREVQVLPGCFALALIAVHGVLPNPPDAALGWAGRLCMNGASPGDKSQGDEQRLGSARSSPVHQICAIDLQNIGIFFT